MGDDYTVLESQPWFDNRGWPWDQFEQVAHTKIDGTNYYCSFL